jgi:putative resolvase
LTYGDTGTIIVTEGEEEVPVAKKVITPVVIYARVSSPKQQADLDRQVARLEDYCAARGYQVGRIDKEIGSGVNDSRRKFLALLADPKADTIVVEHQDLLQDLSSIVYSMCARLYGQRRAKRKQVLIGKILANGEEEQGEEP